MDVFFITVKLIQTITATVSFLMLFLFCIYKLFVIQHFSSQPYVKYELSLRLNFVPTINVNGLPSSLLAGYCSLKSQRIRETIQLDGR